MHYYCMHHKCTRLLGEVITLRKNLIGARKRRELTVVEAARKVGVRKRMYYYYEDGSRDPSLSVALKLEELYKVPISELLVHDFTPDSPETKEKILENSSV